MRRMDASPMHGEKVVAAVEMSCRGKRYDASALARGVRRSRKGLRNKLMACGRLGASLRCGEG